VYAGFLSFVSDGLKVLNALLSSQLSLYEKLSYLASYIMPGGATMRIFLDGLKASREALVDTTLAAPKLGIALTDTGNKAEDAAKKVTKLKDSYLDMNAEVERLLKLKAQFDRAMFEDFEVGFKQNLQFLPPMTAVDETEGELVELKDKVKDFSKELQLASNIGAEFGGILTQAFTASLTNGENFFKVLGKALQAYVAQLVAAVAATIALSAIVSSITGASFKDTFKAMQGSMGGMANFFGDSGIFNMKAKVSGSDLQLGVQRSGNNFSRVGG
jgi:hypothetical protein